LTARDLAEGAIFSAPESMPERVAGAGLRKEIYEQFKI
jgi:hypothetical protein